MSDEPRDEGLGPAPPSPERGPDGPAPSVRSPDAPDWWQPGMSVPPGPTLVIPPLRVERGKPIPLREMGIGEVLDAAIKIYRASWRTFLGAAAIVIVPVVFLQSFLTRSTLGLLDQTAEELAEVDLGPFVATVVIALVQFLIVTPFLTAVFARATSDLYLGGRPDLGSTFRYAGSRIPAVLLVSLLSGLAVLGGFLLLIVPAVIFYVRFAFSPAVVVVEDLRGRKAMGRSWRLARDRFWPLFGTLILANILATVVASIAAIPLTIAAEIIGPAAWPLGALGTSLAEILTRPFAVIIVVLLYFDLRIRKEGFDLAVMMHELNATPRET